MPDLDRAVRSWEEWDRGIRSGDARALEALGRLLAAVAKKAEQGVTEREVEVLQLMADGATIAGAAGALGISADTVKEHLKKAYVKLGARNRPHAVRIAMGKGLVR